MAQKPLVSIVTPAYKAEPYIGQAIESVLAQTMPDWELIIVEDCSPDNTAQVVERYLDDPRITLLHNEQNLGEGASRNRALEVAQGEWITLLDADDWYAPNRLERLLTVAQEMGQQVVIDLFMKYFQETQQMELNPPSYIHRIPKVPTYYDVYQYVMGHFAGQPLMHHDLIRKERLQYIPGVIIGPDYIFQIQVIYRAKGFILLPEGLYFYRRHPSSIIQQTRSDLSKTHVLYQTLLSLPEVQQDARLRKAVLFDYQNQLGCQKLQDFRRAVRKFDIQGALSAYREAPAVIPLFLKGLPAALARRLKMMAK